MRKISLSEVILITILIISLTIAKCEDQLIDETCKRTPDYELCVASLLGKEDATDLRAMAQIMAGILLEKAKETLETIRALLKSVEPGGDAAVERSLAYCAELYIPVVKFTIPQAIEALIGGHFGFANYGISDVAKQADACAKSISGISSSSSLSDANDLLSRLSQVTAAIVHILLHG